jgi:hypothetical protein
MNRLIASILAAIFTAGFLVSVTAAEVTLVVTGTAWDSDSRGFASIAGLSVEQGTKNATRRGSRISVDGRPEVFAISGAGGAFELTFSTDQPGFRLIAEGDRFPRAITQPITVPEDGGELDVGRVDSPRAEGPEHTWPLPMAAAALGYESSQEMLADNKAAIRLLTFGSGAEGAPAWAYPMKLSFPGSAGTSSNPEPTTTSPFLMRVPQTEYVLPFDMNTQDTYFLPIDESTGAWIIIVSFAAGEDPDKAVVLELEDMVTDELLDPPRPWKFSPKTILVRNGYATEVRYQPDLEQ